MTARRMQDSLTRAGIKVQIYAFEEESGPIEEYIEKADIIHALHVRRTADWLEDEELSIPKPLVLTSGGTDINLDLFEQSKKQTMERLLEQAETLTVFTEDGKKKVEQAFPMFLEKTLVIPQGVPCSIGGGNSSLVLPNGGGPNVLLPAGLRPVKDVLYVLEELEEIRSDFPGLQFILIGEPLDKCVREQVRKASIKYSWFLYFDPVDQEEMKHFYEWSDLVINTSHSEGQPISLLEGMANGVPVLARDNAGNKSVVRHGYNGYLFSTTKKFNDSFRRLLENKRLYKKLSKQALRYVQTFHHPDEEAAQYIKIYNDILEY